MAGAYCPFCGKPTVPGGTFCASCGAALAAPNPHAGGAPPPPVPSSFAAGGSYPPGYGMPVGPAATSREIDRQALSRVQWAAVLGLVGAALSLLTFFSGNALSFLTVTTTGTSTTISTDVSALYLLVAIAAVGLVLSIVEILLYRGAFRTLAPVDSRFTTPATFLLVLLVALVILVLTTGALFAEFLSAIQCAGAGNPITTSCFDAGNALSLVALLLIAALVAIISYIGGVMLGLWRLGTRYDETTLHVGAILIIIPILNIIGLILILVGARSALGRLEHSSRPMTFG